MRRNLITLIVLAGFALNASAKVRTELQKKAIAAKALQQSGAAMARGARAVELKELRTLGGCSLVGYEGGAFVVVSNDDSQAEVLGVATSATKGDNPGFEWWLAAINEVLEQEAATATARRAPGPDAKKYPSAVEPLITTHWGQGDPYYRLCPSHPQDVFCATGCVATAMAQILYKHKLPVHGFGVKTSYYPYMDKTGEAVTANFAETNYDWDHMLDRYDKGEFSDVEANAVATLMMHCAVAADMQFGGYNHGGSGTTHSVAAEGLRYHFGFENARSINRMDYSDEEWMDMVYGELSEGNPILYGGQNLYGNGGHAFVIHGYREDGFVYVNWGWNGDAEGYYDIDKLNPTSYNFSVRQDMILGISGPKADLKTYTLNLPQAGTLPSLLAATAEEDCGILRITGQINSTDLKAIRSLAGRDAEGNAKGGYLSVLDLSGAEIVAGGEPYLVEGGKEYVTADGELPYKAFYDCRKLTEIKMPKGIKHVGNAVLGGCYMLRSVEWPAEPERSFVVEGDALYTTDHSALLAVMPTALGEFAIPSGVGRVAEYAFAGCVGLSKVDVPASVSEICGDAFRNCSSLIEIRIHGKELPELSGYDVFAGVRLDVCQLKVPSGTRTKYLAKLQWRDFGDNISEYGTTFQANNLDMDYGDSTPRLGYKLSGESVDGEPVLYTEVDSHTLPGDYPIFISAGTVVAPDVEFVNGVLTVYPAVLTVKAVDATRRPDEVELPYSLQFSGFVNGEDETVLQELPVVTTDASNGSAEGTYTLRVSGGRSDRYEFKYRGGTLTVDANAASGIVDVETGQTSTAVFTLDGRRVAKPRAKGIYVRNGKKMVITN